MKLFVVVALALSSVACGAPARTTLKATIPVYTITASQPAEGKFTFDVPTSMKGGVITLELKNDADESHDFQLAKIAAGHTLEELAESVSSEEGIFETWTEFVGGVGATDPGDASRVTLNLPPGDYWYVSTEAQATNGMAGVLTLTGESGAGLPVAAATIVATDYSFTSNGFKAGINKLSFRNGGREWHHVAIVPMQPGATIDQVKEALGPSASSEAPPPLEFASAVVSPVINPGQVIVMNVELQAGTNYAVLCFVPDRGTVDPPHTGKGMISELTIA